MSLEEDYNSNNNGSTNEIIILIWGVEGLVVNAYHWNAVVCECRAFIAAYHTLTTYSVMYRKYRSGFNAIMHIYCESAPTSRSFRSQLFYDYGTPLLRKSCKNLTMCGQH